MELKLSRYLAVFCKNHITQHVLLKMIKTWDSLETKEIKLKQLSIFVCIMPEIRSAIICCGNNSVSRTFCLHVKDNHRNNIRASNRAKECKLNWAEPRELKGKVRTQNAKNRQRQRTKTKAKIKRKL